MPVSKKTNTTFTIPLASLIAGGINPTQWVICLLLHTKNWSALTAYLDGVGKFPRGDLRELYDWGYLLHFNVNPNIESSPENLQVTEKFTDLLYGTAPAAEPKEVDAALLIDDDIAFNELFHAYPAYLDINGQKASARTCDFEAACDQYAQITKGRREVHQDILEDLSWGLANNLVNMGLTKFLASRQWLTLRQARESGEGNATTFDNSEQI